MNATDVHRAGVGDRDRLLGVLVLAFARDPFFRWLWPDARAYLTHFPAFADALGGGAFATGTADRVDGFAGGALWMPPDVHPDGDGLRAVIGHSVDPGRQQSLREVGDQLRRAHPGEPHWYLPLIGVDPARQGRGLGAALLRRAVERIDREALAAYLESANPANIPLYERYGFEVVGTVRVDDAPPLYPMVRRPR